MGSRRYEVVEVTVGSARELKNVNWRHGELKPYAVVWVDDDGPKCSTRVDLDSGDAPVWDEKLLVPLPPSYSSAVLYIDVVHANSNAGEGVNKPLVGSARLPLGDVLDEAKEVSRTLRLKRPSGRPQGRLDVRVAIRESAPRYPYDQGPTPYPYAGGGGSRDPYYAQQQPPAGYPAPTAAGAGYGYQQPAAYGGAPPPPMYGSANQSQEQAQKKSGMGTGLAVGAAAGVLGGLALAVGPATWRTSSRTTTTTTTRIIQPSPSIL